MIMCASEIQTFVFFDCEATGLTGSRVTEVSFIAIHKDEYTKYAECMKKHLTTEAKRKDVQIKYPRVMNKLTLAVNPMKQISLFVEDLTGLNNYNLENQAKFTEGPAHIISRFLDGLKKPVCLVAHNGDRFDFPLLKKEMSKSGLNIHADLRCCDTLAFFRGYYHVQKKKTEGDSDIENVALLQTPSKLSALNSSSFLNTPEKSPSTKSAASPTPSLSTPTKPVADFNKSQLADLQKIQLNTPVKKALQSSPCMTPPRSGRKRTRSGSLTRDICTNDLKLIDGLNARVKDAYYEKLKVAPSGYSLVALHTHLFESKPEESHGAEIDSLVLLKTTAVFGDSFTQWAGDNSVLMSQVEERK